MNNRHALLSLFLILALILCGCDHPSTPPPTSSEPMHQPPTSVPFPSATETTRPFATATFTPSITPSPSPSSTLSTDLFKNNVELGAIWGRDIGYPLLYNSGTGDPLLVGITNEFYGQNTLFVVNARTGYDVWSYPVPEGEETKFTIVGKWLVIGASSEDYFSEAQSPESQPHIITMALPNMEKKWEIDLQTRGLESLVNYQNEHVLVVSDETIYSLDPASGRILWDAFIPTVCYSVTERNWIFFSAETQSLGRLECSENYFYFDMQTGKVLHQERLLLNTITVAAEPGNQALYQIRETWETDAMGTGRHQYIEAVDLQRSTVRHWFVPVSDDVYTLVIYEDDIIYRDKDQLIRLDSANGQPIWRTNLTGEVSNTMFLTQNRLFIGSEVGYVHLVDADTGELLWEQDIWGTIEPRTIWITPIALIPNGLVIFTSGRFVSGTLLLGTPGLPVWPTPTQPPTRTPEPTFTPTPMPVFTLPAPGEMLSPPAEMSDWPAALAAFLTAAPGNYSAIDRLLTYWSDSLGLPKLQWKIGQADLTGNQKSEVFGIISEAWEGVVFILRKDSQGAYLPAYVDWNYSDPKIQAIIDLDLDGDKEFIYNITIHGASEATTSVIPLNWNGETFVNMALDEITSTNVDLIEVKNITGDDKQEITIHGGTAGSGAAGPIRESTDIYALSEGKYILFDQIPEPASNLMDNYFFLMVDAHKAFMNGDLKDAIQRFENALFSPKASASLKEYPAHIEHMQAFAEYQLMLAYLLSGNEEKAKEWAVTGHYPDRLYSQVKEIFWQTYQESHEWTPAAEAARTRARLAGFTRLQLIPWPGWKNETMDLEDVCPCKECRQGWIGSLW